MDPANTSTAASPGSTSASSSGQHQVYIAVLNYANKSARQSKATNRLIEVLVTSTNQLALPFIIHNNNNSSNSDATANTTTNTIQQEVINKVALLTTKPPTQQQQPKVGGIKVKRVVFAGSKHMGSRRTIVTLYIVPLLAANMVDTEAPSRVKFINVPALGAHVESNSDLYAKEMSQAVKMLQHWLKVKGLCWMFAAARSVNLVFLLEFIVCISCVLLQQSVVLANC